MSTAKMPALAPPKYRLRKCLSSKQHTEHLTSLILLMLIQVGVVIGWTRLSMDMMFIIGIGGRDALMILFYAEEFL
jgi:hypothetical protein